MLTKIITTAIAVVVLAAPTSAFYEACFYSDNECTTKVDCLTADEFAEAVTDDASNDDYGPNNMTSCDDYFDMYNAQDHDHDLSSEGHQQMKLNVTVFESCRKNVSPCVSLQCWPALSTACIADCDTKCAECSTSKEASQEETCKIYHCPSTIPGTTTKYLSSQSDCLKTTTMKTTTALATAAPTASPTAAPTALATAAPTASPTAAPTADAGIVAVDAPASVTLTLPLDVNLSTVTPAELKGITDALLKVAADKGGFKASDVERIELTQDGKVVTRRRRATNGAVTARIIFKSTANVDVTAAVGSLNKAIAQGAVTVTVTIGGQEITAKVEDSAIFVQNNGAGATTAQVASGLVAVIAGIAALV